MQRSPRALPDRPAKTPKQEPLRAHHRVTPLLRARHAVTNLFLGEAADAGYDVELAPPTPPNSATRAAAEQSSPRPFSRRRTASRFRPLLLALIAASTLVYGLVALIHLRRLERTEADDQRPLCVADEAVEGVPHERYLVYAPQFGLSNQLVALRTAIVWALLLNRTLVLPHVLGHEDATTRAAFTAVFFNAAEADRAKLEPLRFITMDQFLELGLRPAHVLALNNKVKNSVATDDYFAELGLDWAGPPRGFRFSFSTPPRPLEVSMSSFGTSDIRATFSSGACNQQRVLAFRSLYAAIDLKGAHDYPAPGKTWLNKVALPMLLTPSEGLRGLLDEIADRITQRAGANHAAVRSDVKRHQWPFVCAHVRRGDFIEHCQRHSAESKRADARPWVVSHVGRGWSCLQTEEELALNLEGIDSSIPLYVATEEPGVVAYPPFAARNASWLGDFAALIDERLALPPGLSGPLLDQMLCSRAQRLLLNAWSTFSQITMGHIGLRNAMQVGWTTDLSLRDQEAVGAEVHYWLRKECFDKETQMHCMGRQTK